MTFRTDIQGLRGFAILLVVCYHAHLATISGGFVGVDVFFVLSGYLITSLLLKEFQSTNSIRLSEFYARRVRRLLPASVVVFLTTVLAARFILSPLEQLNHGASGIATALYLSNLLFIRQATDYLASPPEDNPFLHTWSLSVEEQFYLIWPTLILFLLKLTRTFWYRAGAIALIAATSFTVNVWLTEFAQPWAFFGLPARVWELAGGGLLAMVPLNRRPGYKWLVEVTCGLGLVLIVIAATTFDSRTTFPSWAALLPVGGTMLVLASGHKSELVGGLLKTRPMVWMGGVSYIWYLWHWPILVFAGALIPGLGIRGRVVCTLLSLLLSAVTRSVLEDKVRFSPWLMKRTVVTLVIAVVVTTVTVGTSTLWRQGARLSSVGASQARYSQARNDNPVVYTNGCHLGFEEVTPPECAFGDSSSSTIVVLFGDSHAAQWFPAFEKVAQIEHFRLVSFTKSACPSIDVAIRNLSLGRRYFECEAWRHNASERIERLRPNLVVLANDSNYVQPALSAFSSGSASDMTGELSVAQSPADWLAGLQRTVHFFTALGIHTTIMRDSPRPGFDAPTCLARRAWRPSLFSECRFIHEQAIRTDIVRAEDIAAGAARLSSIVDLSSAICDGDTCETERDGLVIYRDHHHLTAAFSATLAPVLAASVKRAVRQTSTVE
jgi:peptidoglycan/LPS O-acetylase OafA/YrhL